MCKIDKKNVQICGKIAENNFYERLMKQLPKKLNINYTDTVAKIMQYLWENYEQKKKKKWGKIIQNLWGSFYIVNIS